MYVIHEKYENKGFLLLNLMSISPTEDERAPSMFICNSQNGIPAFLSL